MRGLLGWTLVILILAIVPTVAQAAACTGACWYSNGWTCGFTAYQEGGICQIVKDSHGNPSVCILYSCPATGGWVPENQGQTHPRELFPWEVAIDREAADVAVTVIEPRS